MKHAPNRQLGELPDSPPAPQQDADALINGQTSLSVDLFCPYIPITSTPAPLKTKTTRLPPQGLAQVQI